MRGRPFSRRCLALVIVATLVGGDVLIAWTASGAAEAVAAVWPDKVISFAVVLPLIMLVLQRFGRGSG